MFLWLFLCFKSSLQLLQLFSRMLQLCFTVMLQKCSVVYDTSPDFISSGEGQEDFISSGEGEEDFISSGEGEENFISSGEGEEDFISSGGRRGTLTLIFG